MINYKFRVVLCILFTPLGCSASTDWDGKEAHMQCGTALIKVTAECKFDNKIALAHICKNYKLEISNNSYHKTLSLPYIPEAQKKLLEEQGYSFNSIVKPGDWAPSTMKCYDNENIVIGYQLGMAEEELVKGSLISYIDAPFFNLSGEFIEGRELSGLRSREEKNPYGNTSIDFIGNR